MAYAEATYNLGNYEQASYYINILRIRREESELLSLESEDLFQQWITELNLEGIIFNTLKRFGKAVEELQVPEFRLLLPIPQNVLDENPNMTPNPGY